MNATQSSLLMAATLGIPAQAQVFTNQIIQVQINSQVEWVVPVVQAGTQFSPLPIDPGGGRFELWTIKNSPYTEYLLDQRYVGAYVPQATLQIVTEDPYASIRRTRADRPFTLVLKLDGMSDDPTLPDAARMVKFFHFAQSYGIKGTGVGIDPNQAQQQVMTFLEENGTQSLAYAMTVIPAADLSKVRGEERFAIHSLEDYQAPEQQIASDKVQIWPVADGVIEGLEEGDALRFQTPQLTITLNDLYPDSLTYAQVYKGAPALGTVGTTVPGSAYVVKDAIPQDKVLTISDWDQVIDESGVWTMEILTQTPFGIDRLDYVTFSINRNIEVNGTFTTIE
jgi:hypothetical protein